MEKATQGSRPNTKKVSVGADSFYALSVILQGTSFLQMKAIRTKWGVHAEITIEIA